MEKKHKPSRNHVKISLLLLKVVQGENIWRCFCVPIDNFEKVSLIIAMCLLQTMTNFCMQNFPFYSALFL